MRRILVSSIAFLAVFFLSSCATFWKATPHILNALSEFEEQEAEKKDCTQASVQIIVIDMEAGEQKLFCVPPSLEEKPDKED
jgi:hypothetical protein